MNYIICDDNLPFAKSLASKIKAIQPMAKIKIYGSLAEFNFKIEDDAENTNAVFMDIKFNDGNGIDAWLKISEKYPKMKVIYVTGYGDDYSQAVFSGPVACTPVAFLTKPIEGKYLANALNRLVENSIAETTYVTIKQGRDTLLISSDEIISISSFKRKLIYETTDKALETYGSIKEILEQLPPQFLRCHNSHIVNTKHISDIGNWDTIKMKNGASFCISRTYRNDFKEFVAKYC